jgi:aspartyl protease family protein
VIAAEFNPPATMRALFIFAGLLFAAGAVTARYADRLTPARPEPQAMAVAAPVQSANSRSMTIARDGRGHFTVDARIDGRRMQFMVDTGASIIALRESAAARLSTYPSPRDYTIGVQTANGVGRAAEVRLNSVEIDGIVVRDVRALVLPDNALGENLLGMSFLSRVKFSHDRGKLVLEQ